MALHQKDLKVDQQLHLKESLLNLVEEDWRQILRLLTDEYPNDEPWCLCVTDHHKPAFLQSPTERKILKKEYSSADQIEPFFYSKNHDIKKSRLYEGYSEDWIFALISLQTNCGYGGKGYYGVVRANGGFCRRPFMGIKPKGGLGSQFLQDLKVALNSRKKILEKPFGFEKTESIKLLWLKPWAGKSSLTLDRLDPFFIEVSRIIRLEKRGHSIVALGGGSKVRRVDPQIKKGDVGDLWAPMVEGGDRKCFSVSDRGFHYSVISLILWKDEKKTFELPLSVAELKLEERHDLFFSAVCGGEGKTDGFFERLVPFPERKGDAFSRGSSSQHLSAERTGSVVLKTLPDFP